MTKVLKKRLPELKAKLKVIINTKPESYIWTTKEIIRKINEEQPITYRVCNTKNIWYVIKSQKTYVPFKCCIARQEATKIIFVKRKRVVTKKQHTTKDYSKGRFY